MDIKKSRVEPREIICFGKTLHKVSLGVHRKNNNNNKDYLTGYNSYMIQGS